VLEEEGALLAEQEAQLFALALLLQDHRLGEGDARGGVLGGVAAPHLGDVGAGLFVLAEGGPHEGAEGAGAFELIEGVLLREARGGALEGEGEVVLGRAHLAATDGDDGALDVDEAEGPRLGDAGLDGVEDVARVAQLAKPDEVEGGVEAAAGGLAELPLAAAERVDDGAAEHRPERGEHARSAERHADHEGVDRGEAAEDDGLPELSLGSPQVESSLCSGGQQVHGHLRGAWARRLRGGGGYTQQGRAPHADAAVELRTKRLGLGRRHGPSVREAGGATRRPGRSFSPRRHGGHRGLHGAKSLIF
jgi:hypothetical protein